MIKRINKIIWVLLICVFSAGVNVLASGNNLISNGGFEQDFDGWQVNSSFYKVSDADKNSGEKSMRLKYTYSYYPTYVTVTREIEVEKNKEYKFSYYYITV